MKKIILIISILMVLVLLPAIGCASSSVSKDAINGGFAPAVPAAPPPMGMPDYATGSSESMGKGIPEEYGGSIDIERKIIKTGYMTLVVDDVEKSLDEISSLASELGGFVVSSNKSEGIDIISGNIAIRIPAQKYDEAVSKLRQLAIQVPDESTNSEDVTEEYIDLKSRLGTLEATEAQYLELMKKAETVEDILKVQDALSRVRQDIEQIKGRMQYIERTSDMSLINISVREQATFQESGWEPLEILKTAVRGLATFGKVLVNILIWLAVFIPLWAIIGVIVWLVIRRRKKLKSQMKSQ
jgi:hypothetical protein